ncbi:MAG: SGNH/GDSL hydrolase family protein [Planctomycetaceae bacterium]|nr:SGNH/GDSL hydrolase family protein [Planctomycetaceae bacterium]
MRLTSHNQTCVTTILAFFLVTSSIFAQPKPYEKPAPPEGAKEFAPDIPADAGQHLALSIRKLENGFSPERPFLIWALGSSYTARLGNGEILIPMLKDKFGDDRKFEYKRMVGNSCPWQYLRGWARQMVIADQPDLVIVNTIGKLDDLEKLIVLLQSHTTADIIIPSIHWRERGKPNWDQGLETAPDQDVPGLRKLCAKYGVEFVELRREWKKYLEANNLPIESLLGDPVHQSPYGAWMVNYMLAQHFQQRDSYAYDPQSREQLFLPPDPRRGKITFDFTGNRVDMLARGGKGSVRISIDGQSAEFYPSFRMTYIQPAKTNFQERRSPARDQSPHGVKLGENIEPQHWTITVLDDQGNYELEGSVTGKDGRGNAYQPFTSNSGQIIIPPEEWRRAERNKPGDKFSWDVERATVGEVVDFAKYDANEPFRLTLASNLENTRHTLTIQYLTDFVVDIEHLQVFTPPISD